MPEALLATEAGLAPHPLAARGREASHVFLGRVGAGAEGLVRELSAGVLRLADNGHTGPDDAHIFHPLPAAASKAWAVAHDIAARRVDPEACLAVGDSAQDLDIGRVLGTVAIVANGAAADARLAAGGAMGQHRHLRRGRPRGGGGLAQPETVTVGWATGWAQTRATSVHDRRAARARRARGTGAAVRLA